MSRTLTLILGLAVTLTGVAAFLPATARRQSLFHSRSTAATVAQPLRMNADGKDPTWGNLNGSNVRIGIIKARWNDHIISGLREGAVDTLAELGVKKENIFETEVPGAYELPMAARFLALSQTCDAIICLGCLVKGETMHFEYICQAVSSGIMSVQLQTSVPTMFGVLTVLTEEQAVARSTKGDADNHGVGWAKTAVEMALLRQSALMGTKGGKPGVLNLGGNSTAADDGSPAEPPKKIFF